jgi:hypothetical protein
VKTSVPEALQGLQVRVAKFGVDLELPEPEGEEGKILNSNTEQSK